MATPKINMLITGTNRGLGLEMVKQILEGRLKVANLFATCRDPEGKGAEALRALQKKYPDILHLCRLDATDCQTIKLCAQKVAEVVGDQGLNLLINNAGAMSRSVVVDSTAEDMMYTFTTNVVGPLLITQAFLPLLRKAAKASKVEGMSCCKSALVGISSLLGSIQGVKDTYYFFPAMPYRVSKAGLNMLTECCADEFKNEQILCSVLHPGWVRTDMGGEDGEIDAPQSVEGMLNVLCSLTEKQTGSHLNYKGETIPW